MIKLGSLFSGSGGFELAGVINDIYPVWASEIEPYPLKVTAARFPNMKQLGDVTEINGAEIEPVDIITFGSPCQDLSVAGKQAGIHDGERSNLFFQAIRIIKEMRNKTNGQYPRFALWENVPGAFSSNKGEDFRAVLEAFANICGDNISIPRPPKSKWIKRGGVAGDGWSLAWRVYDAQYWGVPQRRKRIYLVADFASERAPEILFERESLRGDSQESREAREGATADAERIVGGGCRVICVGSQQGKAEINQAGLCPTITAAAGMSGNNQPWIVSAFMGGQGAKAYSIGYCDDGTTPTIKASPSGSNTVPDVCYCIDQQGGKGMAGYAENVSATLCSDSHGTPHAVSFPTDGCKCLNSWDVQSKHVMAIDGKSEALCAGEKRWGSLPPNVCYDVRGNGDGKVSSTLTGDHQNRVTDYTAVCVGNGQLNQTDLGDKTGALNCMHDQQAVVYEGQSSRKYIVRRLTPLECCRLQGFPNWWEEGVEGSDSARYKMWGNGIALPCAVDVLGRIAKELRNVDENNQM